MQTGTKNIESVAKKLKLTDYERDALNKLIAELKELWPDVKFKLFGSKAKGGADEESDLDILILLPCNITTEIRRLIVHKIFDINLTFETNISPLILSQKEWESDVLAVLPIHAFIEEEGISV